MMKDILSLNYQQLQDEMAEIGQKPFRGKQIYDWLHLKLVDDFSLMTNLPESLREDLKSNYLIAGVTLSQQQESKVDGTKKYLFQLQDGHYIESVLMTYHHGNSVCISSQVGCRMGCTFCASTIGGLERNLTTGEMLTQVYYIQRLTGQRVSNVVVMGIGEPLDNYDNFVGFVKVLTDEHGLNISQRNITVSTCGITPKILQLAKEKLQITLALSLHGTTQEKRERIMPITRNYPLEEVLKACDLYGETTGRRITYEYSLIAGVNDTNEDVKELSFLLKNRNCHLNLIPINPIDERKFTSPNEKITLNFKNKLEKTKINVTIRREMGADIKGACGQLRRGSRKNNQEVVF
jgi:23S rRNA (adenine2503-C2)-methyltransferase